MSGENDMQPSLTLISHCLCPYVQRAAIALAEKQVPFERAWIDLSDKPDWFRKISPLGKVPVLVVRDAEGRETSIFESAVILEYLEETMGSPLHPAEPLERARHRGWIEFGSQALNAIWRFYSATDETVFERERAGIQAMFARIEEELTEGPFFAGERFSLVDAVFAPVFRYFDAFERLGQFGILESKPKVVAWRQRLAARPSVHSAVGEDFPGRLMRFLEARKGVLVRSNKLPIRA
jgi:glutathione S-transferase